MPEPDVAKCFLQPLSAFDSISEGFAGISLLGPRVQIECPFERARGDPVPLLLGLRDTRSSPSWLGSWRPLLVPPQRVGPPTPQGLWGGGKGHPLARQMPRPSLLQGAHDQRLDSLSQPPSPLAPSTRLWDHGGPVTAP